MMKLKHNLCWSRPWWIIHEKLLHLWDYGLVCCLFHCLNYLIPTFVTSNKSDLRVNIHLWMVCCIKYQGYLAYQTLELPCFMLRKYTNTKMTKKGCKKNKAMSILHRNVDPSVKDVECRLQLYKQEMCYFLYKARCNDFS